MKKILIVDEDEGLLSVMKEALNYEGFDVKGVVQTGDVFSHINAYNPDIIILDDLTGSRGLKEICYQIKNNQQTSGLPVMIMSAYPPFLSTIHDCGCNDFIAKPFDLSELVTRLKKQTCKKARSGIASM